MYRYLSVIYKVLKSNNGKKHNYNNISNNNISNKEKSAGGGVSDCSFQSNKLVDEIWTL